MPKTTELQRLEISVLVAVNNTPVVTSAGWTHAVFSWPYNSLPISLDCKQKHLGCKKVAWSRKTSANKKVITKCGQDYVITMHLRKRWSQSEAAYNQIIYVSHSNWLGKYIKLGNYICKLNNQEDSHFLQDINQKNY